MLLRVPRREFRELASQRENPAPYETFIATLSQDAEASRAAFSMALDQSAISSQLIDNVNASVHVRALLTDLFVLDEALQIPVDESE